MKTYKIGRNPDNDIVIKDQSQHVSRYHATLTVHDNGTITIIDQSTNGTYVNSVKVKSRVDYPVSTSDSIVFAKTVQLDWNLISKAYILKTVYVAPELQKPVYPDITPIAKSNNNSTGKIIGWILIGIGIIGIFNTGIFFTFEGICAVSAPIIGGIMLLVKAANKE